jgi:1,4-alpha-glucan branching enzyme
MGWMNDILYYFSRDPVHRKYHHQSLTFSMLYAFSENFVLPLSHDEVVHGKASLLDKMPGDAWQKFANLRLLYGFQYTFPGKKLLFMGSEFGHGQEWNCEQSLDWHLLDIDYHKGVKRFVRDLNTLYRGEPSLHQVDFDWGGFEWIDFSDWESSIISYVRRGSDPEQEVVVVLNFTPVPRSDYRVGVNREGYYEEILNSDAELYGGSNMGNAGGLKTERIEAHGRPWSLNLTLPPLAAVVFRRKR